MNDNYLFLELLCEKGVAMKTDSLVRANLPNEYTKPLGAGSDTTFYAPFSDYVIILDIVEAHDTVSVFAMNGQEIEPSLITQLADLVYTLNKESNYSQTVGNISDGIDHTSYVLDKIDFIPTHMRSDAGPIIRNTENLSEFRNLKFGLNIIGRVCFYLNITTNAATILSSKADQGEVIEAVVDIIATVTLGAVATASFPASVVLGLLYLSAKGGYPNTSAPSYEDIHKTITPRDNTMVVLEIPPLPYNINPNNTKRPIQIIPNQQY